jgi:hypothetical protein
LPSFHFHTCVTWKSAQQLGAAGLREWPVRVIAFPVSSSVLVDESV